MNSKHKCNCLLRVLAGALTALACMTTAWSQVAKTDNTVPVTDSKPVPVVQVASSNTDSDDVIEMSPFQVSAAKNEGYRATQTMSGTRLNSKLSDLAASITVVTKQQLMDTAAVDINDIFTYEGNTEGIYQYTAWERSGSTIIDTVAQTPYSANRIRGVGNANIALGNFSTTGSVPIDSYNLESVEISRGPNANIFGLGGAAGSVNLIPASANTTKRSANVSFRVDSYGGNRSTMDLNVPVLKDKLAFRVSGVHEEKGYVRKPSMDDTNRLQVAGTYRPWKNTTIRASYESYHNTNQRPNSVTPRDFVSYWKSQGSPVWDPRPLYAVKDRYGNDVKYTSGTLNGQTILTGGWRYLNDTTYHGVRYSQEAAANENNGPSLPFGLVAGGSGLYARSNLWVTENGLELWAAGRASSNTTRTALPLHPAVNLDTEARYVTIGGMYDRTNFTKDGVFYVSKPLFQNPGTTDNSVYDWTDVNLAAANWGKEKADTYRIELEQWILNTPRHKLAVQGGFFREQIDRTTRNFVGGGDGISTNIQLDVNEYLLDGTPNPYFLRPYIAAVNPQTFKRPESNDIVRATIGYQLDMTQNKGWSKWLGKHSLAGYAEHRVSEKNPGGYRYQDQMVNGPLVATTANGYTGTIRTSNGPYLDGGNQLVRTYQRYYLGGDIRESGRTVDYGSTRYALGSYDFTWYEANSANNPTSITARSIEDVLIDNVYFSAQSPTKEILNTEGIAWQGFFLQDRIIPTFGWRKDRQSAQLANNDLIIDPNTGEIVPSNQFGDKVKTYNRGETTTQGIVVKVFPWLDLHYNQSDSFSPASPAYTIEQQLLPNPSGEGKDYGFTLNLFSNKLIMRLNRYQTLDKNSRYGDASRVATRVLRLDFNTSTATDRLMYEGESQTLARSAATWIAWRDYGYNSNNGANFRDPAAVYGGGTVTLSDADRQDILNKVWSEYMGPYLTPDFVDWVRYSGNTLSDINDVESKGYEMEISYNPTKYWTIKSTITQQKAVDTNISKTIMNYINARWDTWQSVTIPTFTHIDPATGAAVQFDNAGESWWTNGLGGPSGFYISNVDSIYSFAVANAGKQRPQTREWRANITTNYKLAGLNTDNFLKNISVGGTIRWEDQAIIGFLGEPADSDGVVRRLDSNKPVWDRDRYYVDLMANYSFRMFKEKVRGSLQINVRNVFENGRLQAVAINPDGTPWNYRIIDPRQVLVTATFDF